MILWRSLNNRRAGLDMTDQNNNAIVSNVVSPGEQLRELLVFLFLVVPSMIFSFFAIRQGTLSFDITAYATILRDLALVALIVFFLWRNRESLAHVGWNFRNKGKDVILGAILFVFMFFAAGILDEIFRSAGLSGPSTQLPKFLTARGWGQLILASILVVVVAIAEETIFRGYLILRLNTVTRSPAAAIVLSSIIFSLGHGYEGTAGVATVGFMGLVFALVYVWRQSLVAPMVMHFLQDFIGIVILPLLAHK
jgi:membrane protease YdiL (CAAX protease family)